MFFTAKRMRQRTRPSANRIVVCTSLSTFAYSPSDLRISRHLSGEMGGVIVDVTRSLSQPTLSDDYDVRLLAIFP